MILTFPECIVVDNTKYNIVTSYRAVFEWIKLIDNQYLDNEQKQIGTFSIFFIDKIPYNFPKAFQEIMNFIRCGSCINDDVDSQKSFDFNADYLFIWGAFMSQYNINLNTDLVMHWWEFKSRFDELSDDTKIKQIIQIRTMDLPDPSNQKHYMEIVKLKEKYKL